MAKGMIRPRANGRPWAPLGHLRRSPLVRGRSFPANGERPWDAAQRKGERGCPRSPSGSPLRQTPTWRDAMLRQVRRIMPPR